MYKPKKLIKMNYYSKTEIKNGKYITIRVTEEVISEKEIVSVDDIVFKVIATGAYGQIKISDGFREFICSNPFTNYFGEIKDRRPKQQIIATCKEFDKVLDMTNAIFDLSPEVMSKLHEDVYMKRSNDEYWIELN